MPLQISPQRRQEIIHALRRGTVPQQSLDALATGLERFANTLDQELQSVKSGSGSSKRSAANTDAARRFLPGGSPSVQRRSDSRPPKSKFRKPRHRCTAWRLSIVGSWLARSHPLRSGFREPMKGVTGGVLISVVECALRG